MYTLLLPPAAFYYNTPWTRLSNSTGLCSVGLLLWFTWQRICLQCRRPRFDPWVVKIPCRRAWQPTPVFLLRGSHGQRGLAGYSPWGCKESDTTEAIKQQQQLLHCRWILYHLSHQGSPVLSNFQTIQCC